MRILFLIPTLGTGGAERALIKVVNNLSYNNNEICVKTLFNHGIYINKLNENINYSYVFKNIFRGNIFLFKLFSPRLLYRLMIKESYDVIISFLEGPTTRIVSGCTDSRTILINWVHTSADKKNIFLKSYRSEKEFVKCMNRFNKTIFVAETAKYAFEKLFTEIKSKKKVIYNPIDNKEIISLAKEGDFFCNQNTFNIISVGRFMPVKGFKRLVKIIEKLKSECNLSICLYLVGSGVEYNEIKEYILSKNMESYVKLLGFQSNPYKYIKKCDLYVCSSYREGYSTSVIEALVLGIPVVTTDCSGMREILGLNSEYGMIVKNEDGRLYEGIKEIITNKEIYKKYKIQAKLRGNDFELDKSVRQIELLIDSDI